GTIQIANFLIQRIKENGGVVLNNKEVSRFVVDDSKNKVIAVETKNGERYEAKFFISNIHPSLTLDLLDKTRSIKKAYISRIKSRANTFGIFTTYLTLKKNKVKYRNRNFYIHGTDDVWYNAKNGRNGVNYTLICYQHNKGSLYSDVVMLLTPMCMNRLREWENTEVGRRGKSYLTFKEEYAARMINFVRDRGFDFTDDIDHIYTTTPLSYRDYLGSIDGSAYGIIKDFKCPELSFVLPRTKLENLFFTGQNLNIHGALGVTLTSTLTCAEFVGHEYLAKKIGAI
ncbi:MAG: NAD(P)/FAD-dependent oxidoreductase, partial [Bacteroidales bacterium]|nr:NAD(P)/FAD-dependent oxidoreductase [Bacteroidales bacterium]